MIAIKIKDELLNCPFCGKEPYMEWIYNYNNKKIWSVSCNTFNCLYKPFRRSTRKLAANAWNKRKMKG